MHVAIPDGAANLGSSFIGICHNHIIWSAKFTFEEIHNYKNSTETTSVLHPQVNIL